MNTTRRTLLCAAAALLPSLPVLAWNRVFPKGSVRGEIQFVRDKEVIINGQRELMSPGARVHDEKNRLPRRGALDGKKFTVNYVRDAAGKIREVWILNAQELQKNMPMEAGAVRWQQEQQMRMKSIYMN